MSGPLTLLGDAFASGAAEWAAQRREQQMHERARAERRADIQDERDYQKTLLDAANARADTLRAAQWNREDSLTQAGWAHEEAIYNRRRFDGIKNQLVKDKFLKAEDINNPEAFQAALNAGGPEYERNLKEIEGYKAAIPTLLKSSNGKAIESLKGILEMRPDQIDQARELMQSAFGDVSKTISEETAKHEMNADNGAVLMAMHMAKLNGLDSQRGKLEEEVQRIDTQRFNPAEIQQIRTAAIASPMMPSGAAGRFAAGAPTPKDKDALAQAMAKAAQDYALVKGAELKSKQVSLDNQLRYVNNQYEGIKVAVSTGVAGKMKLDKEGNITIAGVPVAASSKTLGGEGGGAAVAPEQGTGEFAAGLKSGDAVPASQPSSHTPADIVAPPATPAAMSTDAVSPLPPPQPAAPEVPPQPAWWSRDRDPAANQQAVIDFVKGVPAALAAPVVGMAQRMNPQNYVPGYQAGVDSAAAFDPVRAAGNRARAAAGAGGLPDMGSAALLPPEAAAVDTPNTQRAREDEILLRSPWSIEAVAIRNRRGLPPPPPAAIPPALQ